MKISVKGVRKLVHDVIAEQKISASPEYMKKEKIREELQKLIVDKIATGVVNNEQELGSLISDINTAMTALKMVPFSVWQKLTKK